MSLLYDLRLARYNLGRTHVRARKVLFKSSFSIATTLGLVAMGYGIHLIMLQPATSISDVIADVCIGVALAMMGATLYAGFTTWGTSAKWPSNGETPRSSKYFSSVMAGSFLALAMIAYAPNMADLVASQQLIGWSVGLIAVGWGYYSYPVTAAVPPQQSYRRSRNREYGITCR
jgi:hypothetical protein